MTALLEFLPVVQYLKKQSRKQTSVWLKKTLAVKKFGRFVPKKFGKETFSESGIHAEGNQKS